MIGPKNLSVSGPGQDGNKASVSQFMARDHTLVVLAITKTTTTTTSVGSGTFNMMGTLATTYCILFSACTDQTRSANGSLKAKGWHLFSIRNPDSQCT